MMHSVTSRAVDNGGIGYIFTVVDHDGPDIDEDEQEDVSEFLEGKDEREDVVRNRLSPAIKGMECVTGIGRRHDPFMMGLMQRLVNKGMMKTAVNEIDPEICKDEEERELEVVVPKTRSFSRRIV
jgi:hypothetical protein